MTAPGSEIGSDFAFWRMSLALYGQSGIPELCIGLQDDHGIDVNVLFYLFFRAQERTVLSVDEVTQLDAAVAPWRSDVVQMLRKARRALKRDDIAALADDGDSLRNSVKKIELQAEKLQQRALDRIGAGLTGQDAQTRDNAIRAIWETYSTHVSSQLPDAALTRFITALDAIIPDTP